ncbi:MAG: Ig-like domain-containing protein, partial [Ghiorsea sp.]
VAGNVSSAGTTSITTDYVVNAPVINVVSVDNVISLAESGNIITLTGTGEAGASVTVTGAALTNPQIVNVSNAGTWTLDIAANTFLAGVDSTLSATQTDIAGNVSAATTRVITKDYVADAPVINVVSVDNLINPAEDTAGFNLTGTGEIGATVTVNGPTFAGGNTAVVSGAGTWSLAVAAGDLTPNAANILSATQTDIAGNVSTATPTTITTDYLAAAAPVIDAVSVDNLISAAENAVGFNLTGTGEVGATVVVTGGNLLAGGQTATVIAGGTWSLAIAPGNLDANVATTFTATQTDVAGNVSAPTTTTITTDYLAAAAPVIDPVSPDNLINAAENAAGFNLTGTGEAGATVTVKAPGVTFAGGSTAVVAADGTWSLAIATNDLNANAINTLSATQTDVAGNVSAPSVTTTITTDYIANAPSIEAVSTDNLINLTENNVGFNLTGTGEVGATVTVTGGNLAGAGVTAVVAGDNSWSVAIATGDLAAGAATAFVVNQTDIAGNVSADATTTITKDLVVNAPVIDAVSIDNLINAAENAAGFNLTGTGEAGATVTVTGGNLAAAGVTATVLAGGTWSVAIAAADLAAGAATAFVVNQTDIAGNVSADATTTITIDMVVNAPIIDAVSADNLISAAENTAGFNLTGTGEVGATVTVTGANFTGGATAVVAADGTWSLAVAAGDLTANAGNSLSATQTDIAGNVSAVSTTVITTDYVANAPVINAVSTDNLINAAENTTGFNLTGTGEVGATVTVTGGNLAVAGNTAVVAADGTWSVAIATNDLNANASTTLSAIQTDIAGNVSNPSTTAISTDYVVAAPVIDAVSTDNLINAAENAAGFNLTGTGEAGATVNVTGVTLVGGQTTTVLGDGTWLLAVAPNELVANGVTNISVSQTDVAGNVSSATTTALTSDYAAPAVALTAVTDNVGASQGNIASGGATDDTTPTISGTNGLGALVNVYDGATLLGAAVVTGTTWAYTPPVLADATYAFNAIATDGAGNDSAATTNHAVVVDTVVGAPVFGVVSGDNLINLAENNAGFNLTGTGEIGATVTVAGATFAAGNTAVVSGAGTWTLAVAAGDLTANAGNSLSATQTDVAGNVSAAGTTIITTDYVAPVVGLTAVTDNVGASQGNIASGGTTDDTTPTISGTTEAGASVNVYDGATLLGAAVVTGTTWTYTPPAGLANATHGFNAIATDTAGNASAATASTNVIVAAPVTVTFDLATAGAATGVSSDGSTAFLAGVNYNVVIIVNNSTLYSATSVTAYAGGSNLGAGDTISVVGNVSGTTSEILGPSAGSVNNITFVGNQANWTTALTSATAVRLTSRGSIVRFTSGTSFSLRSTTVIWTGSAAFAAILNSGGFVIV